MPSDTVPRIIDYSRTVTAMMARGISDVQACSLESRGFTLGQLQELPDDELSRLGLLEAQIAALRAGRPPIPDEVLYRVLWNARRTCCVCRESRFGVVVHHIVSWAESHSHEESNLVVLCPNHHALSHTRTELTRALPPEELIDAKRRWEGTVRHMDTAVLYRNPLGLQQPLWDYFNRDRLLELGSLHDVKLNTIRGFRDLSTIEIKEDTRYRYEHRVPLQQPDERAVYSSIVRDLFERMTWIDLTSQWSPGQVASFATPGQMLLLQANHRFRNDSPNGKGPGQMRTGYYAADGVRLEFTFDAWECTSNSSYHSHLSRMSRCTSICIARSQSMENGVLVVRGTPLAIGTGFGEVSSAPWQATAIKP